ncbi:hypothetical protein ABBQ38_002520 [Trebouxia sp. C0009 RCD-2024]
MKEANKYFGEIKETGVLGLFPFNQPLQGMPQPALQVEITDSDIKLQGDSLVEYLDRYFVAPEMNLLPQEYWTEAGWTEFEMKLKVSGGYRICKPYMPDLPISQPMEIEIGDQTHTMVYSPFFSPDHDADSLFPYAENAGNLFFNKEYHTYLVSNSRIMNREDPNRPEYRGDRTDYFDFVAKTAVKRTSDTLLARFENLCRGRDRQDEPAKYVELMGMIKDMKVFDPNNPYLADDTYSKQMKNLHWLLGAPHEIFLRIDGKMLMNDQKDDIMRDTLVRDMFYGSAGHPPKTPKQKAAAKPKKAARNPAAKKKRTADGPAQQSPPKRRPKTSITPSVDSAPRQGKATAKLDTLAEAAEYKRQNPTPSMSQGGASSTTTNSPAPKRPAPSRPVPNKPVPNRPAPNNQDKVSEPNGVRVDREAPGPSGTMEGLPSFGAKYGPPESSNTQAIDACLQSGDKELVGVVAGLATVKNKALAEVLAETYYGSLDYVVVKTGACRDRLITLLQKKSLPCPDILPYDQLLAYKGSCSNKHPAGCGQQARDLLDDASLGSDEALARPLPHESTFGAGEWPQGCLGYAFNLVRPTIPGLRARLLFKVLGATLVFATLAEAAQYRKYLVQKKTECGRLITLDGKCINGIGVTMGDSFKPAPLKFAAQRFAIAS